MEDTLKELRDSTYKIIEEMRRQSVGASVYKLVEKVYEDIIYTLEDIKLPQTSPRKYRHSWERKIEKLKVEDLRR